MVPCTDFESDVPIESDSKWSVEPATLSQYRWADIPVACVGQYGTWQRFGYVGGSIMFGGMEFHMERQ